MREQSRLLLGLVVGAALGLLARAVGGDAPWLAERAEAAIDEVFDRARTALLRRLHRRRRILLRRRLRPVPT